MFFGKKLENDYFKLFNGKVREELLEREIFYSLKEAQVLLELWRKHYNTIRHQSSTGCQPPAHATIVIFSSQ